MLLPQKKKNNDLGTAYNSSVWMLNGNKMQFYSVGWR